MSHNAEPEPLHIDADYRGSEVVVALAGEFDVTGTAPFCLTDPGRHLVSGARPESSRHYATIEAAQLATDDVSASRSTGP